MLDVSDGMVLIFLTKDNDFLNGMQSVERIEDNYAVSCANNHFKRYGLRMWDIRNWYQDRFRD